MSIHLHAHARYEEIISTGTLPLQGQVPVSLNESVEAEYRISPETRVALLFPGAARDAIRQPLSYR